MTDVLSSVRRLWPGKDADSQARAWLIAMDDGPAPAKRVSEFRAWLQRSPTNRQAFERAVAAWRQMDRLGELWTPAPATQSTEPPRSAVWQLSLAAAAGVALLAPMVYFWRPAAPSIQTYTTATGEVRTLALADGSRLHLNTGSKVTVSYGRTSRSLQLEAGEAFFEVASDPQRPFVVHANHYSVRALGTAFAVHKLATGVDLTVTNGRVELAGARIPIPLSGGQHATVAGDVPSIEQIDPKVIEKRLSWREGLLLFDDDALTDVVAEISRYTSRNIVIEDPSIRNLKLGGVFKVQDIDSILNTLQENFGVDVRKDNQNNVYLSSGRRAR